MFETAFNVTGRFNWFTGGKWGAIILGASTIAACSNVGPTAQEHSQFDEGRGVKQERQRGGGSSNKKKTVTTSVKLPSQLNLSSFDQSAFIKSPMVVSCTLENGDQSSCVRFVLRQTPAPLNAGPFCYSASEAGNSIWEWQSPNNGLFRVDQAFFSMLEEQGYGLYKGHEMIKAKGLLQSSATGKTSCISVTPKKDFQVTVLVPMQPVVTHQAEPLTNSAKRGISLSGNLLFSRLQLKSSQVKGQGVSLTQGLPEAEVSSSHLIGYSFDGFGIYGRFEESGKEPADLDACGGHFGYVPSKQEKVYHYHLTETGSNMPGCFAGVTAKNNLNTRSKVETVTGFMDVVDQSSEKGRVQEAMGGRSQGGPGQKNGQQQGMPPGFDEAAQTLGVSADALLNALNEAGGPNADLSEVAEVLGVSVEALENALPAPPQHSGR